MKLSYTQRFLRAYQRLSTEEQTQVNRALRRMEQDLRYPSLHVEKVEGAKGSGHDILAARASRSIRFTFEQRGERILLRTVGKHDDVYRRL